MAPQKLDESKRIDEIFKITSILSKNTKNSLNEMLKLACELLGAEIGMIVNVKRNVYKVYRFYNADGNQNLNGQILKLSDNFCRITLEQNKVFTIETKNNSQYLCFEEFGWQSYIGVPIKFNEQEHGTLSFLSKNIEIPVFSQTDKNLVQSLGLWVTNYLERLYYKSNISIKKSGLRDSNKELAAKNENLRKIMQEKNQLTQILVHDLKSPLSNIKMFSFLFKDFVKDKESEELLEIFNNSLEDAFHLISQMETLNSLENFELKKYIEDFDLDEFLQENLKNFHNTAEVKEIKINYSFDGDKSIIKTDQNFLKRIIHNLVSNAIKFSSFKKNIYVTLKQNNSKFEIAIKDEGPGIKESEKSMLFDRFSMLSNKPTNKESSSGLGLFIVKELIKSLNGEIEVDSVLQEGSTFRIILPEELKAKS